MKNGAYECYNCRQKAAIWCEDYDFEDFGIEGSGVVHTFKCKHCGAEQYVLVKTDAKG